MQKNKKKSFYPFFKKKQKNKKKSFFLFFNLKTFQKIEKNQKKEKIQKKVLLTFLFFPFSKN